MTEGIGHRLWCFSGGNIPLASTGREPEFTSRDELCLLNTGSRATAVRIDVYFRDRDPVGPFELEVAGERVRHVPVNNLIDPQAIPLGEPFGLVLSSDLPIVAQLNRTDTRRDGLAIAVAPGLPIDARDDA